MVKFLPWSLPALSQVGKSLLIVHSFPLCLPDFREYRYLFGPSKESSLLAVRLSHNFQTKRQLRQKSSTKTCRRTRYGGKGPSPSHKHNGFIVGGFSSREERKHHSWQKRGREPSAHQRQSAEETVFSLCALTYLKDYFPRRCHCPLTSCL